VKRGEWDEIELADAPDDLFLVHPGWVGGDHAQETLSIGIREVGWFRSTGEAFRAAEEADLRWGWIGVTEDRTVVICDSEGFAGVTGEKVTDIRQVTLARITT
jgi:hypothetical protein